jgi:Tol biopolymer transport system component
MDKDGKNVTQLTDTPGYDGGAFFSADCSKIVWRASRPEGEALADYQRLLKDNLVRPSKLEIYVADADGNNVVQVTNNGKANFAPYLHPDNKRLLYVSNKGDPKGRNFDIYLVNTDGTGDERVTTNPTFDGFPMFSHDGKKLVFASNRNNDKPGDTNLFLADWVD